MMVLRSRRGFALSLVLWLVVGGATLAFGLAASARSTVLAASNRLRLDRGFWKAHGCIERFRAIVDDTLRTSVAAADGGWRFLDSAAIASPLLADCDLSIRPLGVALNVNVSNSAEIAVVLRAAGVGDAADSVADAIVNWRETIGLFRSREELARVRGLASHEQALPLLDIQPGRIFVLRAPEPILLTLPGFGPEAVARATVFAGHDAPADLLDFSTHLSPSTRAEILANFAELQKRVTWSPDGWIVTARAAEGVPAVVTSIEVTLVRAGSRAGVTRWRTWP